MNKRLSNIKNFKGKVKWLKNFFRIMNELGVESISATNRRVFLINSKKSIQSLVIHIKYGKSCLKISEKDIYKLVEGFANEASIMQYDIIGALIPYFRANYFKGERAWAIKDFNAYDYLEWLDKLEVNASDILEEIKIKKLS